MPVQEPLLKPMATLETVLTKWQTDVRTDYPWRFRRANELAANMICSIPHAEALRCGFAPWFVKMTKRNILDSATSSTAVFLKIQEDRHSPEALCVEFMNVFCAASHCGHTPETVILMFHACLRVLKRIAVTLVLRLRTVCSCVRCFRCWPKPSLSGGGHTPREQGKFICGSSWTRPLSVTRPCLQTTNPKPRMFWRRPAKGGTLRYYPAHSFTQEEQRWISHFEARLFDLAAPKVGCSMRWAFEKPAWNSTFLKGFLRAEPYHSSGIYVRLAYRKRCVDQWLRGVVTVLQQDSIPVYSGRIIRVCDGMCQN